MITPFQPDLFSRSRPGWVVADAGTTGLVEALINDLGEASLRLTSPPEQSQGLEINSNNLRLTTRGGRFLLKRWSDAADIAAVERTLELMDWLGARGLPVPAPMRPRDSLLIHHRGSRWSLFPFIEGSWFSGRSAELEASADISGRLSLALGGLPQRLLPGDGPQHLSDSDHEVLARMERERPRWESMLGAEHASMLASCWDDLMLQWRRLRDDPPLAGPVQAAHFDLHPHNLLMDRGHVTAVLDFEACKMMPIGYAIAFAGLKQGRQAVVARDAVGGAGRIGEAFLSRVVRVCPALAGVTRYADLALAETLRRLSIIIRLNIAEGVTTWNKVLPIQLAHLSESRLLFNS